MKKERTEILTTTEIANLCAVDPTTVLYWIKAGKLKSYHTPGGHNRVLKEDLWDFIKKNGLPFLGEKEIRPDSTKKRVLLVDDNSDFLMMLKKGLASESDWLIETADSSLEAGLKVGSWHPDLIVMDIKMPGFDGIDFCRFLKKSFNYSRLPVIVVTGFAKEERSKQGLHELEIFDYLEKPFPVSKLVEKMRIFFKAA